MFDNDFDKLSVEEAIKEFGFEYVRSTYEHNRELALDEGNPDKAAHWDQMWAEAAKVLVQQKRIYWTKIGALSLVVVLLLSYSFGIYGPFWTESWLSIILLLGIMYAVALAVLGNLYSIAWWASGASILGSIIALAFQSYWWLKTGSWLGLSVADGFAMLSIFYPGVHVEYWVGLTKLIDGTIKWYLERSLSGGLFYFSVLLMVIGSIAEYWQPPSENDW